MPQPGPGAAPRPRQVLPVPLARVAALVGAAADPAAASVAVTGITHDSRAVRPGDLYAALPGERAHGGQFAAEAAAAGAVAALTDPDGRPRVEAAGLPALVVDAPRAVLGEVAALVYGEPTRDLLLIGVTGTSGKTTTAYLMEAGLRAAGHRTGLVGTVETRIGDEVVPSVRTTPESTDLQALFAVMRERGCTAVAMEVSSHALVLGRVAGTTYDVALFTNLGQDHLDFHADLEDYYQAKASLFTKERSRHGVVNVDDPWGARLAGSAEVPVTTLSASGAAGADWRAGRVALDATGSTFRAEGPGVAVDVRVGLPGAFNVVNALGALATLATAGVPAEAAARGISALTGVPGRMERVEAGQDFLAVVDYAHKPDALEAVLTAARALTRGRLAVVVGCGGDRDRGKRPVMGAVAARLADLAVLTSDNPRSEDPREILAAMEQGAASVPAAERGEVVVVPDRGEAIALAAGRARPGDAVVVAGKGHEQGQEAAGEVRPFDDRAVLRAAIRAAHSRGPAG